MARFNIRLGEFEEKILKDYMSERKGVKKTPTVNELIKKGLDKHYKNPTEHIIRMAVREQMEFSIKPVTESIASLASKVAYMAGRTMYLLVQIALDGLAVDKSERSKIKKLFEETSTLSEVQMGNKE